MIDLLGHMQRQRSRLALLLPVAFVAAVFRLLYLNALGPFVDEVGHIYLPTHPDLEPLIGRIRHGKVFGYVLYYPFAKWSGDPVYSTRFFMGCLGIATTVGIFLLAEKLAGRVAACIAALIWATLPYVVFHDRLALHDPIVSFFVVFSLLATVSAFEKNGSKTLAFSAGVLMGLAILTKVYAAVCLVWVFAVAIAMAPLRKEAALVRLALVYFAGMVLPVVPLVPVLASAILSENPTAAKFLSGSGITRGTVAANVSLIHSWFKYYTSVPFELYCVACSVAALIRPGKLKIAMLACFTVSITVFAVALKVLFARYLVVMLVPMVLLVAMVSAEGLGRIKTLFSVHERGTSPRRQRACASGTGATVESE